MQALISSLSALKVRASGQASAEKRGSSDEVTASEFAAYEEARRDAERPLERTPLQKWAASLKLLPKR